VADFHQHSPSFIHHAKWLGSKGLERVVKVVNVNLLNIKYIHIYRGMAHIHPPRNPAVGS